MKINIHIQLKPQSMYLFLMSVVSFLTVPFNGANLKSPSICVKRMNKRKLLDAPHENLS